MECNFVWNYMQDLSLPAKKLLISNDNWTEWSAILSEIICKISKSSECPALVVWFEITAMISDQNLWINYE